jgi:lipoprotein LprG
MHLTLRSSGVPDSANGPLGADGSGTHAPAFKGTLDARISGIQAKVEVVALDKVLYVKLPFTTGFTQIDPEEYHAPNPAQLFATEGRHQLVDDRDDQPGRGSADPRRRRGPQDHHGQAAG